MHQTSSRLLRMTGDERPFTKDFKDLFSTLIVSLLPLSSNRVRLTKVHSTFLSEDAISNLSSLKFSQSNRMPDPKDPSRIVTTTTTTTFSMTKEMARTICQRFVDARFIESADGKMHPIYTPKGSVWRLTPKGVTILRHFCNRNGIQQKQISEFLNISDCQLVILERNPQTDKLVTDRSTIEVIFRRFIGIKGPNVKNSVNIADSDSLSDYRDGLTGVKMAAERKVNGRTYKETFTGRAATDWLMDCCTTVDRRETIAIATLFVEYGLISPVSIDCTGPSNAFQSSKTAIYQVTRKGKDILHGVSSGNNNHSPSSDTTSSTSGQDASDKTDDAADVSISGQIRSVPPVRDSNTQRLDKILNDAALRLLFREHLCDTHCEENLSFYLDVAEFVEGCRYAIRAAQKSDAASPQAQESVKEIMAQAYGIYNAFLASGSPCELNIDHQLRNNLATRMTRMVGPDNSMVDTLEEIMGLFEDAQSAVFKLMASDSVPKFMRCPKYEHTLRNYDLDAQLVMHVSTGRSLERNLSHSRR